MASLSSYYPQPLPIGTTSESVVVATGSSASRSLGDRFGETVNVKDFGAKGDGVTNDRDIIQNLLDTKDVIYFPEGTYAIFSPATSKNIACLTVHREGSRIILHPKAILKHSWTGTFEGKPFVDIRASDVVWDGGILDGGWNFAGQGTSAIVNGPNGTEYNNEKWFWHDGLRIADQSYQSLLAGKFGDGPTKPTADDFIKIDNVTVKNLLIRRFRYHGFLAFAYAFQNGGVVYPTRQKGFGNLKFENMSVFQNRQCGGIFAPDDIANPSEHLWGRYEYPRPPRQDDVRKPIENVRFTNCQFLETARVDSAYVNGGNGTGLAGFVRYVTYENCIFKDAGRIGFEAGGSELGNLTFKGCYFNRGYYRTFSIGGENLVVDNCTLIDAADFHEPFAPYQCTFKNNRIYGLVNHFLGGMPDNQRKQNGIVYENNVFYSIDENKPVLDPDVVKMAYNCTGDSATNTITAAGHNFINGNRVRFVSLTGGNNLSASTLYFVRDVSGSTFKISTTSGGSAESFGSNITSGKIVRVHQQYGRLGIYNVTGAKIANNTFRNSASITTESAVITLTGANQVKIENNVIQNVSPSNTQILFDVRNSRNLTVSDNHAEWVNYPPATLRNFIQGFQGCKRLTYKNNTIDCLQVQQVTITNASPAFVNWTNCPLNNGDCVRFNPWGHFFPTGNLPTQIRRGWPYYVVNKTTNGFELAAAPSGTPINSSGGSGTAHTVTAIGYTRQQFASGGFAATTNHKRRTWSGSSWSEENITPNISSTDTIATASIVGNGTTATVVTTTNHGLSNGNSAVITGAVNSGFNGRHVVTFVNNTTFTFPSSVNATASVQGTVQRSIYQVSNTPALFPSNGEIYVVGSIPTGAWSDYPAHFATWNGSSWTFVPIHNVHQDTKIGTQEIFGYDGNPNEEPTYGTGQPTPTAGESWLSIEGGLVDSIIEGNNFTNNGRITYQFEGGVLATVSDAFGNLWWNCVFENNDVMPRTFANSGTANFFHCRAIGKPSRTIPTFFSIKGAFVPNLLNNEIAGWRNNRGSVANAWDAETNANYAVLTGTGAPSASAPNGSIFLRTDGDASTTIYVMAGGSWKPMASWEP